MSKRRETIEQALRRLLANGPLTAFPTRPEDEQLLLLLAARRFEPRREYREAEVNERLREWLRGADLPVRVADGPPHVLAIGIGERELRA